MDIIEEILKFDEKIKDDVKNLSNQIENCLEFDFSKSVEFILEKDLNTSIFDNIPNKKGIYLFEVKLNDKIKGVKNSIKIRNFAKMYSIYKNRHTYSSKIIKSRLDEKLENHQDEWLPIYIGKRKEIRSRIKQHIELPLNSRTYAMKLNRREKLYGLTFRVSYIEINVEHYDFIMGYVENKLREKYKPIIGKQ